MSSLINRIGIRNKSSDKMLSNSSHSNNSNPNRNVQKRRTGSGSNPANIKTTSRKSNSSITQKKQKEIHFEGDLDFTSTKNPSKKTSEKSNKIYNLINKNIGSKVPLANLAKFKPGPKQMTRKSPIPISSSNYLNYNINKMNNLYSSMNRPNNFLIKSNSNHFFKNQKKNVDRSYSPIARVNEQGPKLSPNLVRPKYISKSPLLNNSSLINGFKRFNNASLLNRPNSGLSKRNINHVKADKPLNRPKSSSNFSNNINRISRQYNHNAINNDKNKNHIGNILSFNANSFNNTGNINVIQNISIVRPDTDNTDKNFFKDNRNNHNSDYEPNHNSRTNINTYKPDTAEHINYNYIKDNTNSPIANSKSDNTSLRNPNIHNINRPNQSANSNISNSHYTYVPINNYNSKLRSISALPPSQIANHQIEETYKKKIKNIHQFTHVGYDGGKDKDNNQDKGFIEKKFANYSDYMFLSI